MKVQVIGAGLAGCEAAWQLAKRGVEVTLWDIKPEGRTPAHVSPLFAELVCSNSLRAANIENAVGLLKEEMRRMGSLIIEAADSTKVPAGGALAVDREAFAQHVTDAVMEHPLITFKTGEVTKIPSGNVIVATGPLTTDALSDDIAKTLHFDRLHFYDAAAPIVSFESIDMNTAFFGSRYGKGTDDYINCPMTKEQYIAFWTELKEAEEAVLHGFEDSAVFEGCMPIEVMARRGEDTMRFGPLKPVGLPHPVTGEEFYAVIQLRQDNAAKTLYNLVGFQTHLKFPEQKRVFSMIPGLENAEFVRYGVMHRNTYINSPGVLSPTYRSLARENLYFAGQMTGVEGYVESASSGFVSGLNMAMVLLGKEEIVFPKETAIGALGNYIATAEKANFQPMNVNFGIVAPPNFKFKGKKNKNEKLADRSLLLIAEIAKNI